MSQQGIGRGTTLDGESQAGQGEEGSDFAKESETILQEHIARHYNNRVDQVGVFNGQDLLALMESTGIPVEEEEVRPLVPDWFNLTLANVMEVETTARMTANVSLAAIRAKIESDTVYLGPMEYLRYKLPCFDKDPALTYKSVKFSLDITPRQMLFASTGVILLVTGMAILLLMSMLWLQQANERENVQMSNFHQLLASFTESFEQRFIQAHGESMVDQVNTVAKMVEKQYEFEEQETKQIVLDDSIYFAQLLDGIADLEGSNLPIPMMGGLNGIRDMLTLDTGNEISLQDVVKTVVYWKKEYPNWEIVMMQYTSLGTSNALVQSAKLECEYGPCNYNAVPCLSPNVNSSVPEIFSATVDVHRNPSMALALHLTRFNTTICASILDTTQREMLKQLLVKQVKEWNEIYFDRFIFKKEIILGEVSSSNSVANWLTEKVRPTHSCHALSQCNAVDASVFTASALGQPVQNRGLGYSGDDMLIGATPTKMGIVVVVNLLYEGFFTRRSEEIISILDYLNFNSDRTTELSVGRKDPVTGVITAQVNQFRFVSDCFGECKRREPSKASVTLALQGTTGWLIHPDYRPAPVLAGRAYISTLQLAMVLERDVVEIRGLGLNALIITFNENNHRYAGSLEVQLLRQKGMPSSKTYDRYARCDQIAECVRLDMGVVYRSDCIHCERRPILDTFAIEYLTDLKNVAECEKKRGNCSKVNLEDDHSGVAYSALTEQSETGSRIVDSDYTTNTVLAVHSFISNLSVALIVKMDKSEIDGPITSMIALAVGIAVAIVLLGLALLIFFSRRVLDKIEFEWLNYKRQIDGERKKFELMVKNVIPKCITDMKSNDQRHAAYLPRLSFVFLDVVSLSEKTKNWPPEVVCRYLTYLFTVVEAGVYHFGLHKVRMFGDTYFAVGGLADNIAAATTSSQGGSKGASKSSDSGATSVDRATNCALRVAHFGAVMIQLVSNKFAHFPHRIELIRDTFHEVTTKHGLSFPDAHGNPDDVGHVLMPQLRIGMHYGPGTFCVVETGRTPMYEIFGKGVALAARMQATSQGNKLHITSEMKSMIESVDTGHQFGFDAPRKTVVKGQGTITSYFVNSAYVPVPGELLEELCIEYSNLRVFYEGS